MPEGYISGVFTVVGGVCSLGKEETIRKHYQLSIFSYNSSVCPVTMRTSNSSSTR
jgi:hypothetical protein